MSVCECEACVSYREHINKINLDFLGQACLPGNPYGIEFEDGK